MRVNEKSMTPALSIDFLYLTNARKTRTKKPSGLLRQSLTAILGVTAPGEVGPQSPQYKTSRPKTTPEALDVSPQVVASLPQRRRRLTGELYPQSNAGFPSPRLALRLEGKRINEPHDAGSPAGTVMALPAKLGRCAIGQRQSRLPTASCLGRGVCGKRNVVNTLTGAPLFSGGE